MKWLLLVLTLSSGCSIKHKIEADPIKVETVTINHYVTVDRALVREYFTNICTNDVLNDTQEKIDACVTAKTDEFLNGVSYSAVN